MLYFSYVNFHQHAFPENSLVFPLISVLTISNVRFTHDILNIIQKKIHPYGLFFAVVHLFSFPLALCVEYKKRRYLPIHSHHLCQRYTRFSVVVVGSRGCRCSALACRLPAVIVLSQSSLIPKALSLKRFCLPVFHLKCNTLRTGAHQHIAYVCSTLFGQFSLFVSPKLLSQLFKCIADFWAHIFLDFFFTFALDFVSLSTYAYVLDKKNA